MERFEADQVGDLVRRVIKLGNCILQEEGTGHSLSVFEDFEDKDKEKVTRDFCAKRQGPFVVYSE